jgi:hypothetical protein
MAAARVDERPYDVARAVYVLCAGTQVAGRKVERSEGAIAVTDEALDAVAYVKIADDLARVVDAVGRGILAGRGIIDGGEDVDWHAIVLLPA